MYKTETHKAVMLNLKVSIRIKLFLIIYRHWCLFWLHEGYPLKSFHQFDSPKHDFSTLLNVFKWIEPNLIRLNKLISCFVSLSPFYFGVFLAFCPFRAICVSSFEIAIHKKKYGDSIYILTALNLLLIN
jgi:hypothetical protein